MRIPQYSPIAPLPLLRQLLEHGLLDNYLLLLAHDVVKHPAEYESLIHDLRAQNDGHAHIIMDNGVIENGAAVSLDTLLEAAAIAEANVVVAPDALMDFPTTKKLCMEQVDTIREDYEIMLIPQGRDFEEVKECIFWMSERFPDTHGQRHWGIPRWMANEFGTRQEVIFHINNWCRGSTPVSIHLLGMSQRYEDDIRCARIVGVTGIDSANPLVLGYNGLELRIDKFQHMERKDYWDNAELNEAIIWNLRMVRQSLNGI